MSVKVKFNDLSRIHAPIKEEILSKFSDIIDNNGFVLGPEVESFEKNFAEFTGTDFCVGVNSGFHALQIALQALGVGPGDEVLVPCNTYIATALAVDIVGAKPVFVDAEKTHGHLDPSLLEKAMNPKVKAIMPVHLYGNPVDMDPVLEFAKKHNLYVVEDTAQAHGATYKGRLCGSIGDIGCFSFYPGKNLGAMGDGGGIATSNEKLYKKIRMFRDMGQSEKYVHEVKGQTCRLHPIQAAILNIKLKDLAKQNQSRNDSAKFYDEAIGSISGVQILKERAECKSVYHLYIILLENSDIRAKLMSELNSQGIQSGMHYPTPIHLQNCYKDLGHKRGDFPVTEDICSRTLSLPIFPYMETQELEMVASALKKFF